MRIGVDFRFLSAGRSAVNRGVGRHSQLQLREVLRLDTVNQYVLVCRPDADKAALDPQIVAAGNVEVATVPEVLCHPSELRSIPEATLRAATDFQRWLYGLDLDLYHLTVPFLHMEPSGVAHDACPLVATQYDLIPIVYREHYLAGPEYKALRRHFASVCRTLRHADGVLAISEFARSEVCAYLGVSGDRTAVAYPVASPSFRPIPASEANACIADLSIRVGRPISPGFVLCVSHLHHSKNLRTLLRGFSFLPRAWSLTHPLVLVCDLNESERGIVEGWAREFGVEESFITTGFVSDHELVALYNAAHLYVHPSRHEGFGLPVLEALQCGAPVIASRAAALPEVVGEAGVLVDPEDPQAFATAILDLGSDEARRQTLKERGPRQAMRFLPEALGKATLACYERSARANQPRPHPARRPRIAMWTPLPPQESGVADYSAELVPRLAQWSDLELFVDDGFEPSAEMLDCFRVFHFSAFERRHRLRSFDLILYQMGTSRFHLFMADAVNKWPGLVVLHDLTWSHVLYHLAGTGTLPKDFRASLSRLEGLDAVRELEKIEQEELATRQGSLDRFLTSHPMLGDIVSGSRAIIVHYPEAKRELEERYPGSRVFSIPMGVKDPLAGICNHTTTIRRRHGLNRDAFVIGAFGIADPVKRIGVALDALVRLKATLASHRDESGTPAIQLIVVGAFLDPEYEIRIRRRVLELGLECEVRILGRVTDQEWNELLLACDVVVNLRYPFRKQMSATVMRAIAAGKPIAVTKLNEWAFLPERFCAFVPVGESEAAVLASFLDALVRQPYVRETMSHAAREYYLEHATLERMSENYRAIVGELLNRRPWETAEMTTRSGAAVPIRHSKACNIEDFRDSDLGGLIREIFPLDAASGGSDFPVGHEDRRQWATAMAVRAFREFGVLRPDTTVLGIGAGTERAGFYLTQKVGSVVATDRYLGPGPAAGDLAPMLVDPERFSQYPFDRSKLSVRHMDGRLLDFPDASFDGVFCLGALYRLGDWMSVAAAAYEAGRVLKPGGLLSVATTLRLAGPQSAMEAAGTLLLDEGALRRYIVAASGLELVDDLDTMISDSTLSAGRDLASPIETPAGSDDGRSHLVSVRGGHVVGSIHLALRKGRSYPAHDNHWAAPSDELRAEVTQYSAGLADRLSSRGPNSSWRALGDTELGRTEVDLEATRFAVHLLTRQILRATEQNVALQKRADALKQHWPSLEERVQALECERQDLAARVHDLSAYIEAVRASRPWRVIAFLRRLVGRSW